MEAVKEEIVNDLYNRDYTSNASVLEMLFHNCLEI